MNLFVTDYSPALAALDLDDKRVTKIGLEAAQIICTILHERGYRADWLYRPSHEHSGVTCWLRDVPGAMGWTVEYGLCLTDLYETYGRKPYHASRDVLLRARDLMRPVDFVQPARWQNSARRKHGPDFSHIVDVRQAYRSYLCARWPTDARAPVWTGRPRPRWARWPVA